MADGTAPKRTKITQAKGRPWIYWVGKQGIDEIEYFPAQETERFDPEKEIEQGSWTNLLFHGDNKEVMGHLLNNFRGQVDLVYIDPPFDSKADYVRKVELRGVRGKKISGEEQSFLEQVQYNDLWANDQYLQFMYERLILLRELMSEKGSIYLHCDWHQSHRLRCLMDEVFGESNFQREIIWDITVLSGYKVQANNWIRGHDTIFYYTKNGEQRTFNKIMQAHTKKYLDMFNRVDENGEKYLIAHGIKRYLKDVKDKGKPYGDVWNDIMSFQQQPTAAENIGYPTQKPESLLERIIKASSNEGDLVLDVFCGCGTTAAVAQKLGRRWIASDINHGAIQTASKRLQDIIKKKNGSTKTQTYKNFRVLKVNDYDLQVQHNEALEFAIDKIGIQKTPNDRFFDGIVGDRLVKIIPLNRSATIADLDNIEREIAEIRPDDTRDILVVTLGAETDVQPWIEDKNKLRQHAKNNHYELKDLRETGFFEHRPAEVDLAVKKEEGKVRVTLNDFHSPTICARLDIDNKKSVIQAEIPDFRAQIDCVLIDMDYNGEVFDIDFSDLPEKKADLVHGRYEFDADKCGKKVAVKVIDMLGEEVVEVREV